MSLVPGVVCQTGTQQESGYEGEREMLDLIMVVFGVGMFVCFLAYTALCEKI